MMSHNYYDEYRPTEQAQPYQVHSYLEPAPQPPKKERRWGARLVALCLVFALLGGIGGGVATWYVAGQRETATIYQGNRLASAVNVVESDTRTELTLEELYARVAPSTVGIMVEHVQTNYFGQQVSNAAAGSGSVLTENGYILTNYHVIFNEQTRTVGENIQVSFVDGTSHPAVFVGGEPEKDIAVLKIEAEGLTPVVLGKSANLNVGEEVAIVGNPLGELTFTMTNGIVSALDRSITTETGTMSNMIQTNTAMNPGNSGGPMFNLYGEMVGIVNAKQLYSSSGIAAEGLGFVIAIDSVAKSISDLMTKGYVTGKPYMGILVATVTEAEVNRYGLPRGALVSGVAEGSCSAEAGLLVGDIIVACNGQEVTNHLQLITIKDELAVGDTMELTVRRSGETVSIHVVLTESTPELQERVREIEQQTQQEQQQQQGGGSVTPRLW